jgi:putative membrane-bound dehydrogenase-like protein
MHAILPLSVCLVILCTFTSYSIAANADDRKPTVLDDAWQLQLVAIEPDLVTPISCRFDLQGRLLVVESHTHFPQPNYAGPKNDRIYLFDQFDASSQTDHVPVRKRLFYEGGRATMGLAILSDGWVMVSSRSEVIRIRDSDGDDIADQREVLLTLDTKADYPHNGLGGITVGPDGLLYVGQGENSGSDYRLIAADGSQQTGGGEGGNIFRCTTDGKKLERVATGFWNPFGVHFDPTGRLWTVENDPDARPPCRLLHVIPGGDYGFEFRFGRAGTNPLIAWNGELPGTLPMVSGTGEAPCAVLSHDSALWVTSWGSNRIERYHLEPEGASWKSAMDIVVQGEANFRPVDMSIAPDGSLYFTDWVDRSYSVHGQGRLWRLSKKASKNVSTRWPEWSQEELRANQLQSSPSISDADRLAALDSSDPFIRQSSVFGISRFEMDKPLGLKETRTPRQQLGLLMARRWQSIIAPETLEDWERQQWLQRGLNSVDSELVVAAIRWSAESNDRSMLSSIRALLQREDLTPDIFACAISAIAYLESGNAASGQRDPVREKLLYEFASQLDQSAALRASAIRMIPPEAERPSDEELGQWISRSTHRAFGGEIVRLLAARGTKSSLDRLAVVAADEMLHEQVRADAVAGLAKNAGEYSSLVDKLSRPGVNPVIRNEVARIQQRTTVSSNAPLPQPHDIAAWDQRLGDAGDFEAGRRVFMRTTCANCHAHSGRGSRVGPDLTKLAGQMTRQRILESILLPSREVGPLYVPWRVLTMEDKTLTGMRLETSGAGDKMHFIGADGLEFQVPLAEIQQVQPSKQSIMPDGLQTTMSLAEFQDLMQFLQRP